MPKYRGLVAVSCALRVAGALLITGGAVLLAFAVVSLIKGQPMVPFGYGNLIEQSIGMSIVMATGAGSLIIAGLLVLAFGQLITALIDMTLKMAKLLELVHQPGLGNVRFRETFTNVQAELSAEAIQHLKGAQNTGYTVILDPEGKFVEVQRPPRASRYFHSNAEIVSWMLTRM
jgi:hypothetical protein